MSMMRVVLAVAKRTSLRTLRRPVLLTFSFVQPLMWLLFFGFLFRRFDISDSFPGLRYLDFLLPGVCVMTVLFGASQSGIGLIRDMNSGFFERVLTTPNPPALLLLGKVLADALRLVLQAVIVLFLGALLGAEMVFAAGPLLLAFCLVFVFGFAFASLSCLVALRTRVQETMATFVHVINMPVLFTSTALVPAKDMPAWLAQLAGWNPLSHTVDILRAALLQGETASLMATSLLLVGLAVVCFTAAAASNRLRLGFD